MAPRIRVMKVVVLKPRPVARGSVGEVGVRRAKPTKAVLTDMKVVILKPRPAARGSVGEVGVRRAKPITNEVFTQLPLVSGSVGLAGVRCATPLEDRCGGAIVEVKAAKKVQDGEIPVSLSEDENCIEL